jgi:cystathionine beta-lyase/cystathionine gamma-synthase
MAYDRSQRFETRAIHAGQEPDPATGAVITPIYQTSTFAQEEVGKHKGYDYSRSDNPTRTALQTALAALEDAEWADVLRVHLTGTFAVSRAACRWWRSGCFTIKAISSSAWTTTAGRSKSTWTPKSRMCQ